MAKRSKGEGSLLRRTGSPFWWIQYYTPDGRQIRISSKTKTKMEALTLLRKVMSDRDRGLAPITDARKLTYAELRAGLLANYVERGNKSLATRADGTDTIAGLPQLDDFFGFTATSPGPAVVNINTDTAREFVRKRQSEGVGSAVINRSLACLRRMLRIAHEDGKIQTVPVIRLLKEPPARKGFLDRNQFEELVALLPTHLRPLILFLYWCGVRLGEALQIEWPQVDLARREIRLEEEQTKNAEPRVVPLPSVLVSMLADIDPKLGRVFDATNLRKEWTQSCAACGLGRIIKIEGKPYDPTYKGLIVHDLRRSAVRNLVNAGVPETVAMRISGHKTRSIFDRYAITSGADLVNAMRRVEAADLSSAKSVQITPVAKGRKRLND
jgi:integrase